MISETWRLLLTSEGINEREKHPQCFHKLVTFDEEMKNTDDDMKHFMLHSEKGNCHLLYYHNVTYL